jgi:transposase
VIRGLMTDDEWAYFEPFLIRKGGRPPRNHRRVLDAVFWLMRTGIPWRDLPEELGNWNSVFRQFRRWADSGVWDVILARLRLRPTRRVALWLRSPVHDELW